MTKNGNTYHVSTYEEMQAITDAKQWDVCIVESESRSYIYNGVAWELPPEPPEPPEPEELEEDEEIEDEEVN